MKILAAVLLSSLFVFLIVYASSYTEGMLNPKGIIALAEKNLMITAFSLMMLVVIPVFVLLFSFAWHFRAGNTKATYAPEWHENTGLEIVWWCIPAVIVIALSIITWKSTHDLDPYKPIVHHGETLQVEVIALEWKWLFIYKDLGVATVNLLPLPIDRPTEFSITADAPMNGFWIPQLAGQVYAMTGMTAKLHVLPTHIGEYRGLSSHFSGNGFSGMKFGVKVMSEQDFSQFIETSKQAGLTLGLAEYDILRKKTSYHPELVFGNVEQGLYDKILMRYMSMDMSSSSHSTPQSSASHKHNP